MDHRMPSISETNRLQDSQPRPFFLLIILAYTCVIFTSAWPSSFETVYKSAPSVSIMVANVWRLVW